MICASSEDSDQPGHPPSLIRVFAVGCPDCSESSLCAQWVAYDPILLQADSADSDQTGRMPRLIRVFAGRTDHFVGFVMPRLNFQIETTLETIAYSIVTNLHMRNEPSVSVVPKPLSVDGMISPMIFDSVDVAKCL